MTLPPGVRRSLLWLSFIAILVLVLVYRLQLSFDLGAFLPRNGGPASEVLLQQLGGGPGSRLLVVGISGGEAEQRREASRNLQLALSELPLFVQVLNGEAGPDSAAIPEPVASRYPLMADLDYSEKALSAALRMRLQDLAWAGSPGLGSLIASDPFLASMTLMQQLAPGDSAGGIWLANDGSAVLLAESQAAGTDLQAQSLNMEAINAAFSRLPDQAGLQLAITGVGPFAVELQRSIQDEARFRSILAALAVALVLLLLFRSLRLMLLLALPVGAGFLAGLAMVSMFFDNVHGITLAFGITLLGVAVDFPIHLYTHHQRGNRHQSMTGFWKTLWLGAVSTALAYLAMLFSGAEGLAQLGLFSMTGVMTAALVTRYWLHSLLPDSGRPQTSTHTVRNQQNIAPALLALLLVLGFFMLDQKALKWDDQLASLSPVPNARIQTDRQLRAASATFSMRYQLRLEARSLEQLLQDCESLNSTLGEARQRGLLAAWSSPCLLLPSLQVQQARWSRIPDEPEIHQRLQSALSDSAFKVDAFLPFEHILATAKTAYPLTPADFHSGPLAAWLDAHLLQIDGHWFALVNLADPKPQPLKSWIESEAPAADWVDLQHSAQHMMQEFRLEALKAVALAGVTILLMLALARTSLRRLVWILATAAASLGLTLAAIMWLHGAVNLVHLVSLLLVLGLGLDYSLFLSREDEDADLTSARYSIIACALSTTLAFGILAGSSIPMLRYIGLTVAVGSFSAFALAMLGSRRSKAG